MSPPNSFFAAPLAAGAIALLLASGLAACSQEPNGAGGGHGPGGQPPPAPVTFVKVSREDVRVEAD